MRRARFAAAVALLLAAAPAARASVEQFSTFDVFRQEEDDENLLDRTLVRSPRAWRDEWERSPSAFRTGEGCFTSGQWYLDHELKLRTPLGRQSHMDLKLAEVQDEEAAYDWLQFEFRFPVLGTGLWGVRFRPNFDKSRQDFAAMYDYGDSAAALHVQLVMTIEDTFNELWSFRQNRVGGTSEPYEVHPYEPALHAVWRDARTRAEISGTWLTPSRKRFDVYDPALQRREELWGVQHAASVEHAIGPWSAEVCFDQVQVRSGVRYELQAGDGEVFRRRSLGELALRRRFGLRAEAEARWSYQDRDETWRPPVADARFHAIDRMPSAEIEVELRDGWHARSGFLRNRVTVATEGSPPGVTWGTRNETRLFFGLQARFGRVRVQGIECVELDREPYSVSFHHDKGFLNLQTTF